MNTISKILHNPLAIIPALGKRGMLRWMDDESYLKLLYYCTFHKKLNLDNPSTFNEKLQWLKLNAHHPIYSTIVDKYEVKKYVADIIGEQYIIPTLGVWERFEDIDFDVLPNKFVLKCTHDSGGLVICKDKSSLDIDETREKINKCLKKNYFTVGREWPYKNVKRRIIAEKYISNDNNGLDDYKIHCFNGKPMIILVCKNRYSQQGMTEDFFDDKWNHLSINRPGHDNSLNEIQKPELFDEMINLAKIISADFTFLRVDFYQVNGRVFFGESTFFPASGFGRFIPEKWDYILGKWISLNGLQIEDGEK